jgi:hypothetical protein
MVGWPHEFRQNNMVAGMCKGGTSSDKKHKA